MTAAAWESRHPGFTASRLVRRWLALLDPLARRLQPVLPAVLTALGVVCAGGAAMSAAAGRPRLGAVLLPLGGVFDGMVASRRGGPTAAVAVRGGAGRGPRGGGSARWLDTGDAGGAADPDPAGDAGISRGAEGRGGGDHVGVRRVGGHAGPIIALTDAADRSTSGMSPPGCAVPPTRNSPGTGERFAGR